MNGFLSLRSWNRKIRRICPSVPTSRIETIHSWTHDSYNSSHYLIICFWWLLESCEKRRCPVLDGKRISLCLTANKERKCWLSTRTGFLPHLSSPPLFLYAGGIKEWRTWCFPASWRRGRRNRTSCTARKIHTLKLERPYEERKKDKTCRSNHTCEDTSCIIIKNSSGTVRQGSSPVFSIF